MPIEFIQRPQPTGSSSDTLFRLTMAYDGSGRRISKTRWVKKLGSQEWEKELVTHYTGIGTEVRENYAGPAKEMKVVVNMPNGLGRYGIEDAGSPDNGSGTGDIPNAKFEWYLKNHLGSTMLVYGTQSDANSAHVDIGMPLAAYDYRAFGEMLELLPPPTGKVTENFTGKEHDDEIALDYFGARYLDPMLGMWVSVDPKRQFASPYLYAGNGVNPVNVIDPDGNETKIYLDENNRVLKMTYTQNDNTTVSIFTSDGKLFASAVEPPQGSYFYTEKLKGEKIDCSMEHYAVRMLDNARLLYPLDFPLWYSDLPFDFKYSYYKKEGKSVNTIGILQGTVMTARDAGNALWGGWTRYKYGASRDNTKAISNFIAGGKENAPSAIMQMWGYDNLNTERLHYNKL